MTELALPDEEMDRLVAALGSADASDVAAYFHPFANLFPLMLGEDGDALGESMQVNGQREQIVMLDGLILEGRNRAIQCKKRGLTPRIRHFDSARDGADPLQFVIDLNINRRHLTESQRAMAAARIATMRQGERTDLSGEPSANLPKVDQSSAAEMLNVSERSLRSAKAVQRDAIVPIQSAVDRGDLPVSSAEALASLPKQEQEAIVLTLPRNAAGELTADARKQLAPIIKEVRAVKQREKKEKRTQREVELGARIRIMPDKKFGLVLEDFEWDHKPYSRETGMDRHPANHYPTSVDAHTPEEIVARTADRFACAAPDVVSLFWTTIPHLAIALRVIELRGLTYKSHVVWNKERNGNARGPGYWVTGEHELLLISTRGNVVAPDTAHFRSSFSAPVGEHSAKPDFQYEFAEFHFPNLPKLELNARRARPGWDAWGFEAPVPSLEFLPVDDACCERDGWPDDLCVLPPDFQLPVAALDQKKQPDNVVTYDGGIPDFLRRSNP